MLQVQRVSDVQSQLLAPCHNPSSAGASALSPQATRAVHPVPQPCNGLSPVDHANPPHAPPPPFQFNVWQRAKGTKPGAPNEITYYKQLAAWN